MDRVTVSEVLALAVRAEEAKQGGIARALYTMGGRMDRLPGGDGYDGDEDGDFAHALGIRRAERLGVALDVPTAAGRVH